MEKDRIIQTFSAVFSGADEHNWAKVRNAMADTVLLDYSSLSGHPAEDLPADNIIDSWKSFLPGFDRTHHRLSEFEVEIRDDFATIFCMGHADHFIGKDVWTVAGTYDAALEQRKESWFVTKLSFHLARQTGNTALPAEALKRSNLDR